MTVRNHIEFRSNDPSAELHSTRRVLIDGHEVLVLRDGIHIQVGEDDNATIVTLKILPHRVSFN